VVTLYDLIPLIFKDFYLKSTAAAKRYYERLKIVKGAHLILSISESTRQDAINLLSISPDRIVNIGIAASDDFHRIDDPGSAGILEIRRKYQLDGEFVLTVSNLDHRKNLAGLLRAFSSLPRYVLRQFCLVVICNSAPEHVKNNVELNEVIEKSDAKIRFLYSIPARDLNALYNACRLFVYASLYEGGGLPVMEAMKCGAPVIASNTSSIPEFVGRSGMLFNPRDTDDMTNAILNVLTNEEFRGEIARYGLEHSHNFSWENVVVKAMAAYERVLTR
jgi:glycosyltransferase involved in cell wall biosynthesis